MNRAWWLIRQTVLGFIEDDALSRGAAIAFYTVTSLAPVLIIAIAIAGSVFGEDAARGAIVEQLGGLMGAAGAELVQSIIVSASNPTSGLLASVFGIATLLLTASGVFGEIQASLNQIWRAEPRTSVSRLLQARAASLGLVATLGFLLLVSLVVSAALTALGQALDGHLPAVALAVRLANVVISFALVALLFAAIYKILPDRKLEWRDVMVGAIATTLLFNLGKTLIGLYLGSSAIGTTYGAAGSAVIVLLWIYYSAQIFLLGAEFTKAWAMHRDARRWEAARRHQAAAPAPGEEEEDIPERPPIGLPPAPG
ncbi:YihY/virulence factor BrkB family protein [Teichococcus cervicalis]|uniref:YihY family protein n=1 Tax=Pseudoroseomonas cervicalis ATCC 49957 TaxID=525371 RepID=D5RU67_9PROT|nr:YihY/virulence factor BrkB family protein [Pseudoroseomonas cervicalis]EFH09151.1 YihY family protein [Pseudoroseomonas cervicalis ATCC 49957]